MNNSGRLSYYELKEWLLEEGFVHSQCQISIYYKYASDGTKIVVLYHVDDCVYWYTSEALGKCYSHWFISISISQMKDHYISVDQAKYDTSIVNNYLDNATVKASTKFYKTTFPYDMIFSKADTSTSDEQAEKLTRRFNIHYRACIGSLIYLLSTRVYFSFAVYKLAKFS